jgi:ribonuclease J
VSAVGASGLIRMLEIVPLGGLGEFGMNMLALTWGETTIVVDAGVMFPIPNCSASIASFRTHLSAAEGRVAALVLTHGHEDHIGGVRTCCRSSTARLRHAADAGAGRAEAREHGIDGTQLVPVRPRERVTVGPFSIEFIRVTHSMPDCVALAIHTPGRRGRPHRRFQDRSDADRRRALRRAPLRRRLGGQGVLALFADSTNVDHRRASPDRNSRSSRRARRSSPARWGKLVVAALRRDSTGCRSWSVSAAQFEAQGGVRGAA